MVHHRVFGEGPRWGALLGGFVEGGPPMGNIGEQEGEEPEPSSEQ